MRRLVEWIRRAAYGGPRFALENSRRVAIRFGECLLVRARDAASTTYPPERASPRQLLRYLSSINFGDLETIFQGRSPTELYAQHRFDLLGSGWEQIRHGMVCRGVAGRRYNPGPPVQADRNGRWLAGRINRANLAHSQRLWQMVDDDYQPIDWHLDFKSGYRWSERTWQGAVRFGHLPGVDIKVPWELGRMQHLPQMALAYPLTLKQTREPACAKTLAREFRNQVLDFIATNPPRFGVNWRCPMDVAIRAANWLVAYDLFSAAGMPQDLEFEAELARSVYAHGRYILANLEWRRIHCCNHYLANVTGLLFIAAYLPRTPEIDAWLAFAVRQLVVAVDRQFTPDGANFEASTSYHRLSAEMAAFGTACTLALSDDKLAALANYNHRFIRRRPRLEPSPVPVYPLPSGREVSPFPPSHFARLTRMAEFSMHVTKPNGAVHQVGDNDNGRFFKFQPTFRPITVAEAKAKYSNLAGFDDLSDDAVYWDEDHLDHRGLVSAIAEMVGDANLAEFAGSGWPDAVVMNTLVGRRQIVPNTRVPKRRTAAENATVGNSLLWRNEVARLNADASLRRREFRIHVPCGVMDVGLQTLSYPDFGLFIWRNGRMYLAVRCGPIGQEGKGGHAHNDQLAIELQIDGEDWIADPGTYLYTSHAEQRNAYRSANAHFVPCLMSGAEPARLNLGLFQLGDTARAKCVAFGLQGFVGMHQGFGSPIFRVVEPTETAVIVRDYTRSSHPLRSIDDLTARGRRLSSLPISYGYGIVRAA